jgi:hypothetical protein
MGRFSNSLTLGKQSWNVLRQDKELAAIPVVSAAVCAVIAVAFGGTAYFTLTSVADPQPGQDALQPTAVTWAVGVVGLFVLGLVAQYFTAALIAGANQRLEGGSPTLGSAMARANKRIGAVFGWAAINVTVGLILQAIADRAGPLGAIAVRLVGAAWNVVTWLALPAIVIGDLGAVDGIKASVQLLKKTWGENLIAQGGLGLLGLLVILPGVLVFGAITAAGLPIVGIPLLFLYVAVASAILSALNGIFRAALYRYAMGMPNTGAFSDEALAGAFRSR